MKRAEMPNQLDKSPRNVISILCGMRGISPEAPSYSNEKSPRTGL